MDFADDARRLEHQSCVAAKLTGEGLLDQARSETPARGLSNGRPSLLGPREKEVLLSIVNFRHDADASFRRRKRPVFHRVRAKFIQRHGQRKRGVRIDFNVRGSNEELSVAGRCKRLRRDFEQLR